MLDTGDVVGIGEEVTVVGAPVFTGEDVVVVVGVPVFTDGVPVGMLEGDVDGDELTRCNAGASVRGEPVREGVAGSVEGKRVTGKLEGELLGLPPDAVLGANVGTFG